MRAVAPTVLLLAGCAGACINDRDTIVREVQSPPGVLTALTGRFERLPPAYYEARVARLMKVAHPQPEELDDLGAALDRLGRSQEAYAVMARKAAMSGLSREARYRLHANRGTFLAHHLLKTKAPIARLQPAIGDIEEAIRLKPNAHFGREGVQLRVLKWIYAYRTDPKTLSLGITLAREGDPERTATALAGLIELGNAWESPDLVAAIAYLAPEQDTARSQEGHGGTGIRAFRRTVAYARLRHAELKAKGLRPLDPNAEVYLGGEENLGAEGSAMERQWRQERDFAEERTRLRTEYVETRVASGRHPDTDPTFWSEWHEPTVPQAERLPDRIEPGALQQVEAQRATQLLIRLTTFVVALLTLVVYFVVRAARMARGARLISDRSSSC